MERPAFVIGIGGRGTLVCSILGDELAETPPLCIDSDPLLMSAELTNRSDRHLLHPGRSPNRSVHYARKMFQEEKQNLFGRIDAHMHRITQKAKNESVVCLLMSSPRGGISNALTFEIAEYLKSNWSATEILLAAVVPSYNRDYVDVITHNAGFYFRRLEEVLKAGVVKATVLISEDGILDAAQPNKEKQNRTQLRISLSALLRKLRAADAKWTEQLPSYIALGLTEVSGGENGASVRSPDDMSYRGAWAFVAGGVLLIPSGVEAESRFDLNGDFTTAFLDDIPAGTAVVVGFLLGHPDIELFKRTRELSRMSCWKLGGVPCPLDIQHSSKKVFVGMPFHQSFDDIYTYGIQQAIDEQALESYRADEEFSNIDIMCKVCKNIQESEFAVVDITNMRPSVMFELGLLYARGKKTILLHREGETLPTDLQGLEVVRYNSSKDVKDGVSKFLSKQRR